MEYVNGAYVLTNKISDYNLSEMRKNMDETDQEEFDKFVEKNWGVKYNSDSEVMQVSAEPVRRGRPKKNN